MRDAGGRVNICHLERGPQLLDVKPFFSFFKKGLLLTSTPHLFDEKKEFQ